MAAIATLTVVTVVPITSLTSTASAMSGDEQYFVHQINALRASLGLGGLAVDANMIDLATAHTADMAGSGSLFHAPKLSIGVNGGWAKLGENVGRGSSAEIVWDAFVNSPAHYANLVDPSFTHIGVSVLWDGGGQLWTTQRYVSRTDEGVVDRPSSRAADREPVVRAPRDEEPQVNRPEPTPDETAPPTPPPPPADPARVSAVLEVLHASPD
jgi:hypothetical protein